MSDMNQNAAIITTAFSTISVTFLIGLVWNLHKSKIDVLKQITVKNIYEDKKAFDALIFELDQTLQDKIKTIKSNYKSQPNNIIKLKIDIIDNIIVSSSHLSYIESTQLPVFVRELADRTKMIGDKNSGAFLPVIEHVKSELKGELSQK